MPKHSYSRWVIVCLFSLLLIPSRSAGQTNGSLSGTLTDVQGGVLPGATVAVADDATGRTSYGTSKEDGRYVVSGLRPGSYRVTASMPGFRDSESKTLVFADAKELHLDFRLQLASIAEELTVRAGTALARDEKRNATNIVDVVSADALARFPDANAAEALRRISGVTLEIDQGEGRFVVVRGVDASLNNVTLNGQIVGTPAEFGTRGVSMDSVPADLISRLEVSKAITPDMDGNAIGASVNIKTLGAFDRPGGFFSGTIRSGYYNMSG